MTEYGRVYAGVYNQRWTDFANRVAPYIADYYAGRCNGALDRSLLDLGCGTGQLARYFLDRGYRVIGIDQSEHMLHYARVNAGACDGDGAATFLQGDAREFCVNQEVGLVVATFDMLNQLENIDDLRSCFRSVSNALKENGLFIFDLVTRRGSMRWNIIEVDDTDEALVVSRGMYDGIGDRAYYKISGFARMQTGQYERFDEMGSSTVFDMKAVRTALLEAGWRNVHFARLEGLGEPIPNPEDERRVFVVAS